VTPEEVLAGAIDVIHERGWARGKFQDDEGHVCLVRAIAIAAPGSEHHWSRAYARARVRNVIGMDAVTWNDKQAKDADEVVEVLKLATEVVASTEEERWLTTS
jgi:hypothetical protein